MTDVGFNRLTWTPEREHDELTAVSRERISQLRRQHHQPALEAAAARALDGTLLSLVALVDSEVLDSQGRPVGQLRDVVVGSTARAAHPPMTGIIVRAGKREVLIGAPWIEAHPPGSMRLKSSRALARAPARRPGEIALAHDVLDRQVVDAAGIQLVRPADLYLALVGDHVELVGVEVGSRALLRRLGPRRLRSRIRPAQVIDWSSIRSLTQVRADGLGLNEIPADDSTGSVPDSASQTGEPRGGA